MVENAQAQDEVLTVDMTPTLYSLATFINSFDNLPAYRIRLKFCALCDSVFSRPDMLRKDSTSSHRQKILDILLGWIQDPTLVRVRSSCIGVHSQLILSLDR
jgi:neurofibromin 1